MEPRGTVLQKTAEEGIDEQNAIRLFFAKAHA